MCPHVQQTPVLLSEVILAHDIYVSLERPSGALPPAKQNTGTRETPSLSLICLMSMCGSGAPPARPAGRHSGIRSPSCTLFVAHRLYIVYRQVFQVPSFRALSGRLKLTVQRHRCNQDYLSYETCGQAFSKQIAFSPPSGS